MKENKLRLLVRVIEEVEFGPKTCIEGAKLIISKSELTDLLAQDPVFAKVEISITRPGDNVRIINVSDVVEPRFRVLGNDFPGVLGKIEAVGFGDAYVLRGVAVVETNVLGTALYRGIIDHSGEGARFTPYSLTNNVVIVCQPKDQSVDKYEYAWAIRRAALKASVYLAKAAGKSEPEFIEEYDLDKVGDADASGLPRIGYLQQIVSLQHEDLRNPFNQKEPIVYGYGPLPSLPTLLHPNEILDGAIMAGYGRGAVFSLYSLQNNSFIKELYHRHGSELLFSPGVLTIIVPTSMEEKDRVASMAAQLAGSVLKLDGIVISRDWTGAGETTQALLCEKMEDRGIKTVVTVRGASADNSLSDFVTIFSDKADAVVSCGNGYDTVTLSPVSEVIGGEVFRLRSGVAIENLSGKFSIQLVYVVDAVNFAGISRVTTMVS